MKDKSRISRRSLLATGLAVSVPLAGCSGGSSSETPTPNGTTEGSGPSLEGFNFPSGASQTGINAETLLNTHKSRLMSADSVSLNQQLDKTTDRFEESIDASTKVSSNSVLRTRTDTTDDITRAYWSPADEQKTYGRRESRTQVHYRIDDQNPNMTQVLRLRELEDLLIGAEWGEPLEAVETDDGDTAVIYEATGVADETTLGRMIFANEVTEFEATLTVTEAGHLAEYTYDITGDTDRGTRQHTMTQTISGFGNTDVQPPEWETTARSEGVQFDVRFVNERSAVELEMVNGGTVPAESRATVASPEQVMTTTLSEEIAVGETRYLSISESGNLRVSSEMPTSGQQLSDRVQTVIQYRGFPLLQKQLRPQ